MKKVLKNLFAVSLAFLALPSLTSCNAKTDYTLVVYNWEDYIATGEDEDGEKVENSVVEDFEIYFKNKTGKSIKVNYETFPTNEEMYNKIKLGSIHADLICPSDYMIQKMIKADMLEKFDFKDNKYTLIDNYNNYGSPYIKDLFASNSWTEYAIPYMWGTMGFTYDPAYNNGKIEDDIHTWDIQWNKDYKGKITVKDSVRDTYFTAVMHIYKEEVDNLKNQYKSGTISKEKYNEELTLIFNRCDDETLKKAEQALKELKDNIYGLEVDDGKNDIVTGKFAVNLAWSGDAVYSLNNAEDSDKILNYVVPEEGSNIWFDGWVMPKGAQIDLASEFLNFICDPKVAERNMDFTGYTSAIAGDAIWSLVNEWYGSEEGEEVDLSYFFNGTISNDTKAVIKVAERNRQFDAQYPDEETIARCAIMKDFGDQTEKVYQMWNNFKA